MIGEALVSMGFKMKKVLGLMTFLTPLLTCIFYRTNRHEYVTQKASCIYAYLEFRFPLAVIKKFIYPPEKKKKCKLVILYLVLFNKYEKLWPSVWVKSKDSCPWLVAACLDLPQRLHELGWSRTEQWGWYLNQLNWLFSILEWPLISISKLAMYVYCWFISLINRN